MNRCFLGGVLAMLCSVFAIHAPLAAETHHSRNACAAGTPVPAGQPTPPVQSGLAFGMNFIWWHVDLQRLSLCGTPSGHVTKGFDLIVSNYDKPGIRSAVQGELKAMHASGFTELRTTVESAPNQIPGYFQIDTDKPRAGQLLREYVSDVAAAGFRHLEIEYGTTAASPSCTEYCLDDNTIARTTAFIVAMRGAMGNSPPMSLSFDLLNEGCPWPGRPNRQIQVYLDQLVPAYVGAFPQDQTTVSCGARQFRIPGTRSSIDAVYRIAGRGHPDYYEVHLYYSPESRYESVSDAIDQVNEELAGSNVPLIVGETNFGDAHTLQELESGLKNAGSGLRAIYFWPKRETEIPCATDIAPPFLLKDAMGE